jgi:hypothetical protein
MRLAKLQREAKLVHDALVESGRALKVVDSDMDVRQHPATVSVSVLARPI